MADLRMLRPPVPVQRADVKQHWHARFHRDLANQWIRKVFESLFVEAPRRSRAGRL